MIRQGPQSFICDDNFVCTDNNFVINDSTKNLLDKGNKFIPIPMEKIAIKQFGMVSMICYENTCGDLCILVSQTHVVFHLEVIVFHLVH